MIYLTTTRTRWNIRFYNVGAAEQIIESVMPATCSCSGRNGRAIRNTIVIKIFKQPHSNPIGWRLTCIKDTIIIIFYPNTVTDAITFK